MSSDSAGLIAADAAARLAAQRELARPFVLEAGAGTGKTATLVARVLAWCLGPGWARSEERAAEARRAEGPVPAGPRRGDDPSDPEAVAARTLDRLVAITFTEAAAAEMAEKVAAALAEVAAGRVAVGFEPRAPAVERAEQSRRARALLSQLDRLNVSTIHAFCRRLLAAHPLAAGLAPDLEVDAEGEVLEEVLREVLDERLRAAYSSTAGDSAYLDLAAAGVGPRELAEAARALVLAGVPAEELEREAFTPALGAARVAELRRAAEGLLAAGSRLRAVRRSLNKRSITHDVLDGVERLEGIELHPAASAALALDHACRQAREALAEDCCKRLREWAEARLNVGEQKEVGEAAPALALAAAELERLLACFAALQPLRFEAARQALGPVLAEVRARLRARGAIHYQALLTEARALLTRRREVRAQVRRGIDQLLVDEFQDTDHVQCDLIRLLALDGPPAERPGLFLVGDPKQSIYGWRSADLAAYDGFVAEVLAAGGVRERLSVNFRSVPAILAEVERLIEPVMERDEGVQPAFQPLAASERRRGDAGFSAGGRSPVEHWLSWSAGGEGGAAATPASKATEIEAAAIARDLRSLHDQHGASWAEAAILLRSTTDLDVYLRALQEASIPYAVAQERSYFRRREILDASALVRAVLDPADHLALVTCLRAPWVGVPDAALPRLWREGLPRLATDLAAGDAVAFARLEALAAQVGAEVAALASEIPGLAELAGWERSLVAFLEALAALRSSFAGDPADVFVDKLRAWTVIEATEAARFLGPWRLANLDRFFRRLAEWLDEGGDAQAVPRFLRQAVTDARLAPEGRPRAGGTDAVTVMTIHKAKGLDFRHVYVPQLHKRPRTTATATTEARELPGQGWELLLLGAPSPGFWQVREHEARVRAAEQVRLLYVAATRAKDRLVLLGSPVRPRASGGAGEGARPPSPARAACFAELLALRRPPPPDAEEALARLAAEGRWSELDPRGVLWGFPDLWSRGEPAEEAGRAATSEQDRAAALPTPAELAAGHAELEQVLAAAATRQARPFSGRASAEAHERLEALFDGAGEGRGGDGPARAARSVAQAVGSAVHRLLEAFSADGDAVTALARARRTAESSLERGLAGAELDAARERFAALVDRLTAGPLWPRFLALQSAIVARELPVLLPPPAGTELAGVEPAAAAPVGFVAGAADLLYRDPGTGELVIVDYKTDEVESDDALAARAAAYRSQAETYQRAVQEGLGLSYRPRCELWFLAPGRVWEEPGSRSSPAPPPPV